MDYNYHMSGAAGFLLLVALVLILLFLYGCWDSYLHHRNVIKHGWPPEVLETDDTEDNATT